MCYYLCNRLGPLDPWSVGSFGPLKKEGYAIGRQIDNIIFFQGTNGPDCSRDQGTFTTRW